MTHGAEVAPARSRNTARLLFAAAAVLLLLAAGWAAGRLTATQPSPLDGGAEAGFARDMQVHHAQAVEMSMLIRDRTGDEEIRLLAYDVAVTQQQQAGQMHGWLSVWGLPQSSMKPAMSWMSSPGAGPHHSSGTAGAVAGGSSSHRPGTDGMMPGMASPADLERLKAASGTNAERIYLELMIPHHEAATVMAEAVLGRTKNAVVVDLAKSIQASQQSEIAYLKQLLESR